MVVANQSVTESSAETTDAVDNVIAVDLARFATKKVNAACRTVELASVEIMGAGESVEHVKRAKYAQT